MHAEKNCLIEVGMLKDLYKIINFELILIILIILINSNIIVN
jgi:hypothetical protein